MNHRLTRFLDFANFFFQSFHDIASAASLEITLVNQKLKWIKSLIEGMLIPASVRAASKLTGVFAEDSPEGQVRLQPRTQKRCPPGSGGRKDPKAEIN